MTVHSSALTDESGAAVPGAAVTVTQVETNQSRSVVTSEADSYNVPNLASGTYEIVSLQGFQTSALEGYTAALRQEVRPFNIHVSMVEVGFLRTPMAQHRQVWQ